MIKKHNQMQKNCWKQHNHIIQILLHLTFIASNEIEWVKRLVRDLKPTLDKLFDVNTI